MAEKGGFWPTCAELLLSRENVDIYKKVVDKIWVAQRAMKL